MKNKCHWCKKFISNKDKQATIRNPSTFYCPKCYKKGLEMEYEAMGIYDKN